MRSAGPKVLSAEIFSGKRLVRFAQHLGLSTQN